MTDAETAATAAEISVARIVLAAMNIEEMAAFYGQVLGMPLQPFPAYGATLYRTAAGGIAFTLCPNSIAGVQAEQSRHQLTFRTANIGEVVNQLREGGRSVTVESEHADDPEHVILEDPDGNTLELVRA